MATEINQSNIWNKSEMDARYAKQTGTKTDIAVTDSANGFVLISPDGSQARMAITNDNVMTFTGI